MNNEVIIKKILSELPIRVISIFLLCLVTSFAFNFNFVAVVSSTIVISTILTLADYKKFKNRGVKGK